MIFIRKAEVSDISTIRKIASKTWFITYKEILSQEQLDYMYEMMYSENSLKKQMNSGHTFFIAYNEEVPCGYVSVEQETKTLFHLQKIYVDPLIQGKGVGRILIEKAFEFAKNEADGGYCDVELNVNRRNKARFFYEKMGMVIDRQEDFPIGNGFFMCDYIMKKSF